jgi:hypothetical protein
MNIAWPVYSSQRWLKKCVRPSGDTAQTSAGIVSTTRRTSRATPGARRARRSDRAEDFAALRETVTANAVKQHLAGFLAGEVRRFELPHLAALQLVCERSLSGGVTTSLSLDAHGKSLSSALLELEVEL